MTEFLLTDGDFNSIAALLEQAAGISLPSSKKTLVYSRLVKRLRAVGATTFADYRRVLEQDDVERRRMVEALTTNTTSFFREMHHFEHLKHVLTADLIPSARNGRRIRIWSAACSTGEEPYSIAMTILSCLPQGLGDLDIKILATDINSSVVEKAKLGIYSRAAIENLPRGLEQKFFENAPQSGIDNVTIRQMARELVTFRTLNLQDPWPMKGPFDAIFCRNVMIYFNQDTQSRLWQRFSVALRPGGILYIGHSERVSGPAVQTMKNIAPTTYARDAGEVA